MMHIQNFNDHIKESLLSEIYINQAKRIFVVKLFFFHFLDWLKINHPDWRIITKDDTYKDEKKELVSYLTNIQKIEIESEHNLLKYTELPKLILSPFDMMPWEEEKVKNDEMCLKFVIWIHIDQLQKNFKLYAKSQFWTYSESVKDVDLMYLDYQSNQPFREDDYVDFFTRINKRVEKSLSTTIEKAISKVESNNKKDVSFLSEIVDLMNQNPKYCHEVMLKEQIKTTSPFLYFIRQKATELFNLIREDRTEEKRWKTDAAAEMGEMGFD